MNEVIIKIEALDFAYKDVKILHNINLEIHTGEMLAFIGQNGAGKTTTAKLLNGINKPTVGRALVKGKDTRKENISTLAQIVGYCYQNPDHQIWALKVYDELAFGPKNIGLGESEIRERVEMALELAGLKGMENEYTFNLGWGQRQRLAVASILAMKPEVIIVDEPTTGLDWAGALMIMDLLKKLNQEGLTVIIITHDMPIVWKYVDRAVVFATGEIIGDGKVWDIMQDQDMLGKAQLRAPQFIRILTRLNKDGWNLSAKNEAELISQIESIIR